MTSHADIVIPILASELAAWYGPHKNRLERILNRLQEHT